MTSVHCESGAFRCTLQTVEDRSCGRPPGRLWASCSASGQLLGKDLLQGSSLGEERVLLNPLSRMLFNSALALSLSTAGTGTDKVCAFHCHHCITSCPPRYPSEETLRRDLAKVTCLSQTEAVIRNPDVPDPRVCAPRCWSYC